MSGALRSKERQRLARIKPPVIEGAAHDRAAEARAIGFGQPPHVLDRSEAARGNNWNFQRFGERDRAFDVEAGERAVTRDVGKDDRRDARVLKPAREIERGNVRGLRPAFHGDHALAGVDADGDPARKESRGLTHEIGIADRRGSNDDPRDAALEPAAHGLQVANAAAELNLHREPGENAPYGLGVDRLAGERAVEIDDMEIFEPLGGERPRLSGGVGAEYGRPRPVALDQANALAVLEIDGGKKNHGRQFRKLAISASPSVWLFSG